MATIKILNYGVRLEIALAKTQSLSEAKIGLVAEIFLNDFRKYSLHPTEITLDEGDGLYDYALNVRLFKGNGEIKRTCDKLVVELRNATQRNDLEIMSHCLQVAVASVSGPPEDIATIQAHAHALESPLPSTPYLARFSDPTKSILSGGTIATLKVNDWAKPIRMMIEPSESREGGIFLSWTTRLHERLSPSVAEKLVASLESAAGILDLTFEPLV